MNKTPARIARLAALLAAAAPIAYGAWWGSKRYVAQHVAQLATARPQAAPAALDELAELDTAAIGPLLDAATCPDEAVCQRARRELELLVSRWALRARRSSGFNATRRMRAVVDGMLARERQLSPSGRSWSWQLARTILAHADDDDPARNAALVARCERLFETTFPTSGPAEQALRPDTVSGEEAPAPPLAALASPQPSRTLQEWASAMANAGAPAPAAVATPTRRSPAPSASVPEGGWSAAAPAPFVTEVISPQAAPADSQRGGTLGWRRPEASQQPTPPSTPEDAPPAAPLQPVPDGQAPIVAATPGPPEEVQAMLEGDEATRLDLVNQLLIGQHDKAPTLLLKLAHDESPRVRAAAISALGSSQDPRLTEAAWRLALHDKDPRVARLARELQKLLR